MFPNEGLDLVSGLEKIILEMRRIKEIEKILSHADQQIDDLKELRLQKELKTLKNELERSCPFIDKILSSIGNKLDKINIISLVQDFIEDQSTTQKNGKQKKIFSRLPKGKQRAICLSPQCRLSFVSAKGRLSTFSCPSCRNSSLHLV